MALHVVSSLLQLFQGLRSEIQVTIKDVSSFQFSLTNCLRIAQTQSLKMVKFHWSDTVEQKEDDGIVVNSLTLLRAASIKVKHSSLYHEAYINGTYDKGKLLNV